ncbi:MAG TPA: hypothetical protein VIG74_06805 [Alphaproteobacteria bacterium]|jgi:hypothetical protein
MQFDYTDLSNLRTVAALASADLDVEKSKAATGSNPDMEARIHYRLAGISHAFDATVMMGKVLAGKKKTNDTVELLQRFSTPAEAASAVSKAFNTMARKGNWTILHPEQSRPYEAKRLQVMSDAIVNYLQSMRL